MSTTAFKARYVNVYRCRFNSFEGNKNALQTLPIACFQRPTSKEVRIRASFMCLSQDEKNC